jgi:predicted amidohydrolase YtcJ
MMGIDTQSVNPDGGVIERGADGQTPNGLLEENMHFLAFLTLLPKLSDAQHRAALKAGEALYIAYGFTTMQDGRTDPATLNQLAAMARKIAFDVDVVAYPDLTTVAPDSLIYGPLQTRNYVNNLASNSALTARRRARPHGFDNPIIAPQPIAAMTMLVMVLLQTPMRALG